MEGDSVLKNMSQTETLTLGVFMETILRVALITVASIFPYHNMYNV